MLQLITDELKEMEGARAFYRYLEKYVYREEIGDEYNGYGGFIRNQENIMFNFDLRSFAPTNRDFFWQATQLALTRIKKHDNGQNEAIESLLISLLDMHKRIKKGEDPMLLNDMRIVSIEPAEKLGPGW